MANKPDAKATPLVIIHAEGWRMQIDQTVDNMDLIFMINFFMPHSSTLDLDTTEKVVTEHFRFSHTAKGSRNKQNS